MDRPTHEDGIRIDWDFVNARDAASEQRRKRLAAKKNLAALRTLENEHCCEKYFTRNSGETERGRDSAICA